EPIQPPHSSPCHPVIRRPILSTQSSALPPYPLRNSGEFAQKPCPRASECSTPCATPRRPPAQQRIAKCRVPNVALRVSDCLFLWSKRVRSVSKRVHRVPRFPKTPAKQVQSGFVRP